MRPPPWVQFSVMRTSTMADTSISALKCKISCNAKFFNKSLKSTFLQTIYQVTFGAFPPLAWVFWSDHPPIDFWCCLCVYALNLLIRSFSCSVDFTGFTCHNEGCCPCYPFLSLPTSSSVIFILPRSVRILRNSPNRRVGLSFLINMSYNWSNTSSWSCFCATNQFPEQVVLLILLMFLTQIWSLVMSFCNWSVII